MPARLPEPSSHVAHARLKPRVPSSARVGGALQGYVNMTTDYCEIKVGWDALAVRAVAGYTERQRANSRGSNPFVCSRCPSPNLTCPCRLLPQAALAAGNWAEALTLYSSGKNSISGLSRRSFSVSQLS